jgi:hypothetical protein
LVANLEANGLEHEEAVNLAQEQYPLKRVRRDEPSQHESALTIAQEFAKVGTEIVAQIRDEDPKPRQIYAKVSK